MSESMNTTCEWVNSLLSNMETIADVIRGDDEMRAGCLDAVTYLAVQFLATKSAYELAVGGPIIGHGYNMLNRLAIGAQAAMSFGSVLAGNQRIGASYAEGMDLALRGYKDALETHMMDLV